MRKKLLDIGFYTVIMIAVLSAIYMMVTIYDLRGQNHQLRIEKEDLRLDYVEMQIQRDNLLDGAWHKNNSQMKEDK
ncbi:hypothetical protein [Oceanobacillus neutriphilus]|uniref:Secreted protein n=1 Tax=Oceanobacillus neutriphilus TaxID=531815 RepID=A0ABQ2NMR9_9BACI|nr:hypothetical protein [Oceanobacillus neutriphilus]GGP07330.1 hypothetical protein GCM10011346_02890 [Oceanobacillus neutriphilus]